MVADKAEGDGTKTCTTSTGAVIGRTEGLFVLEPLSPRVTRITQVQQTDLKLGEGYIGTAANNYAAKYSLGTLIMLHTKYQREEKVVDKEARMEFISKIDGARALTDENLPLVQECMKLSLEYDIPNAMQPETKLKKPSFSGEMSTKSKLKKGWCERSINTGRCIDIIDTCPEEVLAWLYDYCSKERMRIHKEEGNVARLAVTDDGRQALIAVIKHMPWFLYNREFVTQMMWWGEGNGTFYLAFASVNYEIDYGFSHKNVRGFTQSLAKLEPYGKVRVDGRMSQCRMVLTQRLDASGFIPAFILNSKIPQSLRPVHSARVTFNRDSQIDTEQREVLISIIKRQQQEVYQQPELDIINSAKDKFGRMAAGNSLKEIRSPDHLVKMKAGFSPNEDDVTGWAETEVDASIEECAAHDYSADSREKMKIFEENGGLERIITRLTSHSQVNRTVYDLTGISSIHPREWLAHTVWQWDNAARDKFIVASAPITNEAVSSSRFVRATAIALLIFEKLEVSGDCPRTKVTYWNQVNLGGLIPLSFVNSNISSNLMHLSEMRIHFDKSSDIDGASRDAIFAKMQRSQEYSREEETQIKNGMARLTAFDKLPNKKKVESVSPLVTLEIAQKDGERNAFGKASTVVRASAQQVIAYQWDWMARHFQNSDTTNRQLIEEPDILNSHNKLVYAIEVLPRPFTSRVFLNRLVWKKLQGSSYVLDMTSASHPAHPDENEVEEQARGSWNLRGTLPVGSASNLLSKRSSADGSSSKLIRARFPATIRMTESKDDETVVDYLIQIDLGGVHDKFHSYIQNQYLHKNLERVVVMQEYFQQLRPLDLLDEQDGVAMGEAFNLKYTKNEKGVAKDSKRSKAYIRVHAVISSHVALKQYKELNPWFGDLMTGVVSNNILGSSCAVSSRLLTLSNKEARTIGNSLASVLLGSTSSDIAVEDWILTSPAMQELDRNLIWFRPMMNRMAMRLLAKVAWGAKSRLYTGAFLSSMDLITDLATIRRFWLTGNYNFAYANIAFIGAALLIQLLVVFGQNKKRGWKVVAYEMLIVVGMIKPAIDAMRVASGEPQAERTLFDPSMELTFTKCTEMFCESIPSSVLQTYALLRDPDDVSKQAVFSIFISAGCIAFASSTISLDFDTNPSMRLIAPEFYGYIPDKNRMMVFVFMTMMSTAHVLMKALACSLMMRLNQAWFWSYLSGDMGIYFSLKILRNDFRHWLNVSGVLSWMASVSVRVMVKLITDL